MNEGLGFFSLFIPQPVLNAPGKVVLMCRGPRIRPRAGFGLGSPGVRSSSRSDLSLSASLRTPPAPATLSHVQIGRENLFGPALQPPVRAGAQLPGDGHGLRHGDEEDGRLQPGEGEGGFGEEAPGVLGGSSAPSSPILPSLSLPLSCVFPTKTSVNPFSDSVLEVLGHGRQIAWFWVKGTAHPAAGAAQTLFPTSLASNPPSSFPQVNQIQKTVIEPLKK